MEFKKGDRIIYTSSTKSYINGLHKGILLSPGDTGVIHSNKESQIGMIKVLFDKGAYISNHIDSIDRELVEKENMIIEVYTDKISIDIQKQRREKLKIILDE